ncbi:manganese transporter [bacterium]|nr:manganese transporter [bacterium]
MLHTRLRSFLPSLLVLLCCCMLGAASAEGKKLKVVATTAMVADVAREIGGPTVDVVQLMGPGVDPHLYTPTRDDLAKLLGADLVLYSGLHLEGRMGDVLKRFSARKPVHGVADRLDPSFVMHPNGGEHPDPHVWMDVKAWSMVAGVIGEELAAQDKAHAADYAARTTAYQAKLAELDEYAHEVIATIPEESRLLVTAHDAFAYFGRSYGVEVRGIQGISTESEAGLRDLNDLIDTVVARKVKAVFVESSVSEKNVRALQEGAKARGAELAIGGELFSDAMGVSGTWEGTYMGMIDHNVTTITRALGGKAPEGGFRARATVVGGGL